MENDGTPGGETTNNYTLTKRVKVSNWHVDLTEDTLSDHCYITFAIQDVTVVRRQQEIKKVDLDKLTELLSEATPLKKCPTPEDAIVNAESVTKWASHAIESSTIIKVYKCYMYWLTADLEDQRLLLKNLNRKIERCKNDARCADLKNERAVLRAKYRVCIKKEKEEAWRRLIDKYNPWRKPYKIFIKCTN